MKSTSERQTEKLGRRLAKTFSGGETVLLVGELGAGKTRFAKGIARGLGVKETVTSPTFALHNRYRGKKLFLNHFDFYRLSDGDEARAAGLDEYFGDKEGVCRRVGAKRGGYFARAFRPRFYFQNGGGQKN